MSEIENGLLDAIAWANGDCSRGNVHLVAANVPFKPYRIYLNGVEQRGVTEAHLSEGWIIRVVYNDDGSIMLNDGIVLTVKEFGTVTAEEITDV